MAPEGGATNTWSWSPSVDDALIRTSRLAPDWLRATWMSQRPACGRWARPTNRHLETELVQAFSNNPNPQDVHAPAKAQLGLLGGRG